MPDFSRRNSSKTRAVVSNEERILGSRNLAELRGRTRYAPIFKGLKNMAERVGFEFALERKFKNMQRTGCAF